MKLNNESTLLWYLVQARDKLNLLIHRIRFSPEISAARRMDIQDILARQDRIIAAMNTCVNEIRRLHRHPVLSANITFKHAVDGIEDNLVAVVEAESKAVYAHIAEFEKREDDLA